MEVDDVTRALRLAHDGRYLVRVRAVNPSGNTIDIVGYVTEIRDDGSARLTGGHARHGDVHEFSARRILHIERVHGS